VGKWRTRGNVTIGGQFVSVRAIADYSFGEPPRDLFSYGFTAVGITGFRDNTWVNAIILI